MTTGDRIKQRRLELGLSVDEIATKLGKNRATVYNITARKPMVFRPWDEWR